MLKDEIGIFHACLAQAFLGLLVFIALATSRLWSAADPRSLPSSVLWLPTLTVVLIYLQLGLGATMRHQHRDLAILDFPAAYGEIIPDLSAERLAEINAWREARALSDVTAGHVWLQMVHRFVALLIAAGVLGSWLVIKRSAEAAPASLITLARLWIIFLFCQITLGAWTIWSNKAADVATAHVAVGATMLAIGISLVALIMRFRTVPEEMTQRETDHVPQGARAI